MKKLNLIEPSDEGKMLIITALETISICSQGYYIKEGRCITLEGNTREVIPYSPEALKSIQLPFAKVGFAPCRIHIADSDSFSAASLFENPLVMNFANAHRAGGGFLFGDKAQEEALCRASTLYTSLTSDNAKKMYEYNQAHSSPVDSDFMLLSPNVCVFRNLQGELLDNPYKVSVISVPAPDKAHRAYNIPQDELNAVITNRLRKMFSVAVSHNYKNLILGAWGCGVFGNDVQYVANCFYNLLFKENYSAYFENITFAILNDQSKLEAFRCAFNQC